MWKLVIEDDEGKRTVVPLTRDDYTVGRKEGNTIRLTERNVSREHAKLHRKKANGAGTGTSYSLEDLTSYNGVYVNGLRVANAQDLIHGDLIQIGDYRMVLQDDQVVEAPTAVPAISADSKTTIPASLPNRGVTLMERPNRLVMLAGPTPGAEYPLDRERLTVGRAEDATISVNHNSVSRLHCEIHLLGESRYEIVDKGSSNGVRVNSAELKRGIVEAGDIIELGDVKFKFVGAGQIFLPGVNDSQQLAAIGDRAVPPKAARRSNVVVMGLIGVVFAVVLLGVAYVAWMRKPPSQPPQPITNDSPLSKDQTAVDAARALADKGDFEGAHSKLAVDVTTDAMKQSPEFVAIEARWAQDQLTHADKELEPAAKRQILNRVATDGLLRADHPLRVRASDALAALDKPTAVPSASAPVVTVPSVPVTATVTQRDPPTIPPPGTVRKLPTPPPPTADTTPPPPVPTPTPTPPPKKSVTEQAREALLANNPSQAKALLMPIVAKGGGSSDDVRLLKAACDGLKDRACLEFLRGH